MSEAINALWPYDPAAYGSPSNVNAYFAGNFEVTPPPGVVKVTANFTDGRTHSVRPEHERPPAVGCLF
jgi:hypothetical protein